MQLRIGSAAVLVRPAEMFHVVARGAERDEADEALAALDVVELPSLVARDPVLTTDAAAHLTPVTGSFVRTSPKFVPLADAQRRAKVGSPRRGGKEFHCQARRDERAGDLFENAIDRFGKGRLISRLGFSRADQKWMVRLLMSGQ